MNIFKKRQSIRKYKPDSIPPEVIAQLLNAAIEAPSAGNCQPWHFYVVHNRAIKEQLSICANSQKSIQSAPVAIVVCAEPFRSAELYSTRGQNLYAIQDTAAAIENILLCATMHGLGTCWCGAFDEAAVSSAMNIPEHRRPVAIISIGYPKGINIKVKRRPVQEVVTFFD